MAHTAHTGVGNMVAAHVSPSISFISLTTRNACVEFPLIPEQRQLVKKFVKHFNDYWYTGNATLVGTLYDEFISFVNIKDNSVTYGRQSRELSAWIAYLSIFSPAHSWFQT